jgi:hypothetical protein
MGKHTGNPYVAAPQAKIGGKKNLQNKSDVLYLDPTHSLMAVVSKTELLGRTNHLPSFDKTSIA